MIWKWKAWNIALTALGLVLIIFSLIWLLVIFPSMNKLPANHHEIVNLTGNYTLMTPYGPVVYPVNVEREQTATDVQDNVLIMNQTVTTTNRITGTPLPLFDQVEELWVDRTTREYVSGGTLNGVEVDRWGQFCFPEGVEKEKSYDVWISKAEYAFPANFVYEDEVDGLKVFVFEISGDNSISNNTQHVYFTGEMKVEPLSGTTVYSESQTTIKTFRPDLGTTITVYDSNLVFTDDTIDRLVDKASDARTTLLWARVYGFWLGILLGIVLTLVGVLGAIRIRPKEVA